MRNFALVIAILITCVATISGCTKNKTEEKQKSITTSESYFGGDWLSAVPDCDPLNAAINPDAMEVEDGIDNNCNGLIDTAELSVDVLTDIERLGEVRKRFFDSAFVRNGPPKEEDGCYSGRAFIRALWAMATDEKSVKNASGLVGEAYNVELKLVQNADLSSKDWEEIWYQTAKHMLPELVAYCEPTLDVGNMRFTATSTGSGGFHEVYWQMNELELVHKLYPGTESPEDAAETIVLFGNLPYPMSPDKYRHYHELSKVVFRHLVELKQKGKDDLPYLMKFFPVGDGSPSDWIGPTLEEKLCKETDRTIEEREKFLAVVRRRVNNNVLFQKIRDRDDGSPTFPPNMSVEDYCRVWK